MTQHNNTHLTGAQQAAQDSIHDLVTDSLESTHRIRYAYIKPIEKDKLLKEIDDNLRNIDILRRNC